MRLGSLGLLLLLLAACSGSPPKPPPTDSDAGTAVAPDTRLDSGPSGPTASSDAVFTFSSPDGAATFTCSLDQALFATCTSPLSLTRLADGSHTLQVAAVDGALTDPTPASLTWTVDTLAPTVQLTSGPSGTLSSAQASFTFTASEDGTFQCQLDTGTFGACDSGVSYPDLAEGPHTFYVRALDAAGNASAPVSRKWTVDTQAPTVQLTSAPSGAVTTAAATFTFTSDDPTASFQCSLDGAAAQPCSSAKSVSGLADGSHTFTVTAVDAAGNVDATPASATWTVDTSSTGGSTRIRLMAANITSGSDQSYDPGEGVRIFQGLKPDVAMIQEFNYFGGDDTSDDADIRSFVDTAFGATYEYYREPKGGSISIPNGIVSRYPILDAGEFSDLSSGSALNRSYVWARIDVPGPHDLWVLSLHLKASSGDADRRNDEAAEIVADVQSLGIPADDFLAIGGDFNTYSRNEACLTTFQAIVDDADDLNTTVTPPLYAVDQDGDGDTNAGRSSPYDWVLTNTALKDLMVPVTFPSGNTFDHGLVFDSRVYTPLSDVSPVLATDSGASNMQHMAVVRDYLLPN